MQTAQAGEPSLRPLNPRFVAETNRLATATGCVGNGFRPGPVDFSYLREAYGSFRSKQENAGRRRLRLGAVAEPSKWDSRDVNGTNWVTRVGDQGSHGSCWAFATVACLETALLKGNEGEFDLSENHIAACHEGFLWEDGGNGDMATALTVRWSDPLLESQDPYPNYDTPTNAPPFRHVQNVEWIPARSNSTDNAELKRAIRTYGAALVSFYASGTYNAKTGAYYYDGTSSANHAVAAIGWDDDYAVENFADGCRPPTPGAFLIKNSWGTGAYGTTNGYNWVSYCDAQFAKAESLGFFAMEPTNNYSRIYQYDICGLIDWYGYYGTDEIWGANEFVAAAAGTVSSVGFYAAVPGTEYEISVYTNCTSSSPVDGGLAGTQSGSSEIAGYRTVRLESPVPLERIGERFSVVIRLRTPGSDSPLAISYAIYGYCETYAYQGESFYSQDGNGWYDAQGIWGTGKTANFCIKAYVQEPEKRKPTTLYVDASRPDDSGDGFSWETARQSVASAVFSAVDGDRLLVAPGVYGPVDAMTPMLETLTIVATGGCGSTVIDAGGTDRCFVAESNGILLDGFTLRNAEKAGYYGGGAYRGAFVNCIVSNCQSSAGGGIAYAYLTNCLVVCNSASHYGGGLFDCDVVNCTVADNWARYFGGGAYLEEGCSVLNTSFATNVCARGYDYGNDVYGMAFHTMTNCLVDRDARYVDQSHGDYRLSANSPCIDAGRSDFVAGLAGDLEGTNRIVGSAVDIGCYEYCHRPSGWPVADVTPADTPGQAATKVQTALMEAGFPSSKAERVTTAAQYAALTGWAESRGLAVSAMADAPTAFISSALWADSLLELKPSDLVVGSLEKTDDGWSMVLTLDAYDRLKVNESLVKAAAGVVGAEKLGETFTTDGLSISAEPVDEGIRLTVTPPVRDSYFLSPTVH